MIKRSSFSSWVKLLLFIVTIKTFLVACLIFDLSPFGHDAPVQASQKMSENKYKETLSHYFKEGCCHPEFLAYLRIEMSNLEKKRQELDKREKDLSFLEKDIEEKLKKLKELQRRLEGPVKRNKAEEQTRLQHLAGVYSSMDPVRAAALLDKMDENTVTKLFSIMKSKKVARILANMEPDKAARISSFLYNKGEE